jgi:DNA-binding HxlR family transcriptional regulator
MGASDRALMPILMSGPHRLSYLALVIERVVSRGPRLAGGRDEQARPIQRYRLLPTTQVPTILLGTIERGSSKVRRKTYHCPVEATIDVIGGKWKPLILWWLKERTHRFAELRRRMPGITERMLTLQLRELEADGIVDRRVYPTVPPRVEYSLTAYGHSLKAALEAICDWGRAHMERIGVAEASPDRLATDGSRNEAARERA